jgi:hypothetical protein
MNKSLIKKVLYIISIILIICFIVFTLIDYSKYNESYSAPFSAYIFIRCLEFILPSIIVFIIAKIIKQ